VSLHVEVGNTVDTTKGRHMPNNTTTGGTHRWTQDELNYLGTIAHLPRTEREAAFRKRLPKATMTSTAIAGRAYHLTGGSTGKGLDGKIAKLEARLDTLRGTA
jgi:hypothetical protein